MRAMNRMDIIAQKCGTGVPSAGKTHTADVQKMNGTPAQFYPSIVPTAEQRWTEVKTMVECIGRRVVTCGDCMHYRVCYHIEHYGREVETDEPCEKFINKADMAGIRHGTWIKRTCYPMGHICSECGHYKEYKRPYCEICGAKMDGGV